MRKGAADKLTRRLGWMTRAHPFVLDGKRLIVPLYSDGFSFSLMAITDDWGATWHTSSATRRCRQHPAEPGPEAQDGSLVAYMRDNGPPPKRLHAERVTRPRRDLEPVTDSRSAQPRLRRRDHLALRNGHWVVIGNDTERGRDSLAVWISDDEGETWKWKRHLESEPPDRTPAAYHYPSIIQAADGSLHAVYSYHAGERPPEGRPGAADEQVDQARALQRGVGDPRGLTRHRTGGMPRVIVGRL